MNINELTSSIYGTNIGNVQMTQNTRKVTDKTTSEVNDSFANILSSYAINGESDIDEIQELVEEITDVTNLNEQADSNNLTDILTDAHKAQEYLNSKTGRNLLISMAENQIASIISNNSDV